MNQHSAAVVLSVLACWTCLASCNAPKPRVQPIHTAPDATTAATAATAATAVTAATATTAVDDLHARSKTEVAELVKHANAEMDATRRQAVAELEAHVAAATSEPPSKAPPPRSEGLVVGVMAPDFTLSDATGAHPVTLHSLRGKPTVVIFGSCTCPPFVRSTRPLGALHQRYRERVNFLLVYGREAHPTDGWALERNRFTVKQATSMDERRAAARDFAEEIGISMPLVVDTMDGDAERLYGCFPNRLVVIDADGRIAHIGARGPQSTLNSAREAPGVLDRLLGSP